MPATATVTILLALATLGNDTDRIVSISCRIAQGGQSKYYSMLLLLTVLLSNFANVNDPLVSMSQMFNLSLKTLGSPHFSQIISSFKKLIF